MWTAIISWLGSFLGGPFIQAALDAYKAKLTADNSTDKIVADLAARELAVQQREEELQTQYRIATIGRWYMPDQLMGYAVAIYLAKLLIYDKVLGWGTTDALSYPWLETTTNLIIAFYFGKRSLENVLKIWALRR